MPPGIGYPKSATAVSSAPPAGNDAERVKKMMASRPTLNPNQRRLRSKPGAQDLSGFAADGTMKGAGGNMQKLGPRGMARLQAAQQAAGGSASGPIMAPPAPTLTAPGQMGGPGGPYGGIMGGQDARTAMNGREMQDAARARLGAAPGGMPPGIAESVNAFKAMSPEEQMAAQITLANPAGGGFDPGNIGQGPPGGADPGTIGQGPPGALQALMQQQGGAAGPYGGIMGGQGLPPEIMQRLQTLKGPGGPQAGQAGGVAGSLADLWQARGGNPQAMTASYGAPRF